jgi:hypothetical protein
VVQFRLSGLRVYVRPFQQNGQERQDDFRVEIGTVVSFREEFDDPDMPGKTYVIRRMPNLGDTLILSECLIDDNGAVTDILRESTIEVEPWKIGAI